MNHKNCNVTNLWQLPSPFWEVSTPNKQLKSLSQSNQLKLEERILHPSSVQTVAVWSITPLTETETESWASDLTFSQWQLWTGMWRVVWHTPKIALFRYENLQMYLFRVSLMTVSSYNYTSNDTAISDWRTEKRCRSGHGLISGNILKSSWRDWGKPWKTQYQ